MSRTGLEAQEEIRQALRLQELSEIELVVLELQRVIEIADYFGRLENGNWVGAAR
jgi:hypothetical protein